MGIANDKPIDGLTASLDAMFLVVETSMKDLFVVDADKDKIIDINYENENIKKAMLTVRGTEPLTHENVMIIATRASLAGGALKKNIIDSINSNDLLTAFNQCVSEVGGDKEKLFDLMHACTSISEHVREMSMMILKSIITKLIEEIASAMPKPEMKVESNEKPTGDPDPTTETCENPNPSTENP